MLTTTTRMHIIRAFISIYDDDDTTRCFLTNSQQSSLLSEKHNITQQYLCQACAYLCFLFLQPLDCILHVWVVVYGKVSALSYKHFAYTFSILHMSAHHKLLRCEFVNLTASHIYLSTFLRFLRATR